MHEPFSYFEHDADMGIAGRGTLVEEAFEHAAMAVTQADGIWEARCVVDV